MLDANEDLTEEEVKLLQTQREIIAPSLFATADEVLREDWTGGDTREKWLAALQEGRANGVSDVDIMDEFLSDERNYSEFKERAISAGKSILSAVFTLPATAATFIWDSEIGRNFLIGQQQEKADYRRRANLFGSNFGGMVQDVTEVIPELVGDMVASAFLTSTTGAGGVAYLSAKQGAKISAKKLVGNMLRTTLTGKNNLRRMGAETTEDAVDRLVGDGFFKAALSSKKRKALWMLSTHLLR